MRTPDFLPIDILVVGGAVSALTAAIALSRVGHRVTLLDDSDTFEQTPFAAGARIPPNATKIFYRWGMEKRLRQVAVRSQGVLFAQYDSGSVVGSHDWEEEVLEETGGDFLLIHYADLRRILAESAREHGAILRNNSRVVDVHADAERPNLTLANGEVLTADVIIGADGCHFPQYHIRRAIMKALGQPDTETPVGLQLFNTIVPQSALEKLDDQEMVRQVRAAGKIFSWFGPDYGAIGFPIKESTTGASLFTLFVYVARADAEVNINKAEKEQLLQCLTGCDPRLVTLARESIDITCIPMVERPFLEEWVHPQGRVLAIGEAAHPIFAGSLYTIGMATGDSAALGRLFSHLHTRDQIDKFLNALQEIREERVRRVIRAASGNIFAVNLPPGLAETRDRELRQRAEKGLQTFLTTTKGSAETSAEMVEAIEDIFAYDPEDTADNWWVEWGITQERAARIFDDTPVAVQMRSGSP
ncbi:FAD/NAD(P)-binding domain-containing protein [Lentinus tigrinus ALCF2SS1-7]|uniref:FAD/NAD(P)-binding domain-containing protein n=1 Tax=Lentinus tigrinus ALCF2SS1-6 TaxID=1328759 RepID=A0A5C2RSN7_9APHY|nr:FAD/NAD(P)-binding domain-containing protein [Lentinus tigrinus ALCF2SS1-6]RPD73830.1 FAD/NAD(P)-binding domain-containing protein [Lentinus tigrinus ALCF2SS1-7]